MRREVTTRPVDRREFIAAAGSVAAVGSASQASEWFMRGAFLDHAVPGVGLTVSGPVREVRLYFDLGVLAASSSVQVMRSTGAAIAASRPVSDPSNQQVVIVRLGHALPPGTYRVIWHVVTIDQRQASGAYLFTVS
jgi:methionine-rich copper-binding protein CopC